MFGASVHVLHLYHKFWNMELQRQYLSHVNQLEIVVSQHELRNKLYECKHPTAEKLQGLVQISTETECAKTKIVYSQGQWAKSLQRRILQFHYSCQCWVFLCNFVFGLLSIVFQKTQSFNTLES